MQVIHSVAELDAKIIECDRAEAVSEEAMRALLSSFRMEVPQSLPPDPFSDSYRAAQLELYRSITGFAYDTVHEVTKFDVDALLARPFPFYTNSSATAGEYFMAIGFVLRSMALPPNSRVLEFGAGWGYTSLWLAQLGHRVTVVDIEPCFCELISRRAAREGVSIEVINADFFSVEADPRQYDAVLFYDCFHHCDDHMRLLRALKRVVAPEGRLFFGAEPIIADFPLPWGIRLDGWALWGVRKNGWMELGFRDDYFARALSRSGWFGRKIMVRDVDRLRVWEARHTAAAVFRFPADDAKLHTQLGRLQDGALVLDGSAKGTGLFGPYIDLPPGCYTARIGFRAGGLPRGHAMMDVCHDGGNQRFPQQRVQATPIAELSFAADSDLRGLEVRLFCDKGFQAVIDFVEIAPAPPPPA
jgi:SAM-dependent methyltransferase